MKKIVLVLWIIYISTLSSNIINIPQNQPTIQAGIEEAVNGDTVLVSPGTYVENIDFIGKNITVASFYLTTQDTSFISQTVIDGDSLDPVVTFANNENSSAKLQGFSIINGYGYGYFDGFWGGGVYCSDASPTISYCKIYNCYARQGAGVFFNNSFSNIEFLEIFNNVGSSGGGIYSYSDTDITVISCIIRNNLLQDTGTEGGGIFCGYGGNVTIINSIIMNNVLQGTGTRGAGIFCNAATASVTNSSIFGNSCTGTGAYGGGVYCSDNAFIELNDVLISNNSVSGTGAFGGGINCSGAYLHLSDVTIRDNISRCGGGIYINDSNPVIYNTVIKGNSADRGGAIYCKTSNPEIINTLICNNIANISSYSTSAILMDDSSFPSIINSTIANNISLSTYNGNTIFCADGCFPVLMNSILWNNEPNYIMFEDVLQSNGIYVTHSDIQDGISNIITNDNGFIEWLDGNIDLDPLFLNSNNSDFHLQNESPCLGSGINETSINTFFYSILDYDLENNLRPNPFDSNTDMGVFENPLENPVSFSYETINYNQILLSNYPNPFNPTTTISFTVMQNSDFAVIEIYNLKGQKIKSFAINPSTAQPVNSVTWNGTDEIGKPVSSGVYFYKLIAGNKSFSRKMLLLK